MDETRTHVIQHSESIRLDITSYNTHRAPPHAQTSPRQPVDLELLKEEINKIADKQQRKEAYAKYVQSLSVCLKTTPSRPLTKAERREKQEMQRALKQNMPKTGGNHQKPVGTKTPATPLETRQPTTSQSTKKHIAGVATVKISPNVHPAIYQCGLWMKAFRIIGSNARVRATLLALRAWLRSLAGTTDDSKAFSHEAFAGTNKLLSSQLSYLEKCRKKSIGMGNAIRLLKEASFRLSLCHTTDRAAYTQLAEFTDLFLTEKIDFALEKITAYGTRRISNGDVIATFGHSESIARTFLTASQTTNFTVVIIDTPPLFEGKILLRELQNISSIALRYCFMPSITCALNDANKLFIGVSAVMSNGDILSRAGTAMAATIAGHFHLPVIAFCETYKFTNKVWIGSLTSNEQHTSVDDGCAYLYDLTPMRMLDVIVTEYGPLPPCNVCTLIRDKTDVS